MRFFHKGSRRECAFSPFVNCELRLMGVVEGKKRLVGFMEEEA